MPRICFILVAGLDRSLLARAAALPTFASFPHRAAYQPPFPAVTCTTQATLTTATDPAHHGIICNGLHTHNQPDLQKQLDLSNHADARTTVSFWEQSNSLLQAPRFWQAPNFPKKKVAMLFWQNSMPSPAGTHAAADIVLTPKPTHTPDGKTMTACWSAPADLYAALTAKLGPFPLHNYWSPMAGIGSSQWIVRAAEHVWQEDQPDLQLVYIPHLDFNLQRLGPTNPAIDADLQAVDTLLAPLVAKVRADGAIPIIAGDYGISDVSTPIFPNLALRQAGLLATKPDAQGKLLIDYANSKAFVMADHQVAFLYCNAGILPAALATLQSLPGIDVEAIENQKSKIKNPRAGQATLLAKPSAWFAHDWWESDAEKPQWQFTVDIHNKPGFDPRELFFDPNKKCIAQNPALVKGSHARTDDPARWPILLSPQSIPDNITATQIAPLLASLMIST